MHAKSSKELGKKYASKVARNPSRKHVREVASSYDKEYAQSSKEIVKNVGKKY